eukprot:1323690-Rhodomonas_salina.1
MQHLRGLSPPWFSLRPAVPFHLLLDAASALSFPTSFSALLPYDLPFPPPRRCTSGFSPPPPQRSTRAVPLLLGSLFLSCSPGCGWDAAPAQSFSLLVLSSSLPHLSRASAGTLPGTSRWCCLPLSHLPLPLSSLSHSASARPRQTPCPGRASPVRPHCTRLTPLCPPG